MENSNYISDSEWNGLINQSYSELYDLLIAALPDYYYSSSTEVIASGASSIALPSDFYKLRGLDFRISSDDHITLYKYNFERRNLKNRSIIRGAPYREYRIMGSNILIEPSDRAPGTYVLHYVPAYTTLASDTDTLDGINGWEEYVIIDAAMKARIKEESPIRDLQYQKDQMMARIKTLGAERDYANPETITDVEDRGLEDIWPWSGS